MMWSIVIKYKSLVNCPICKRKLETPILQLPNYPLTEYFSSSEKSDNRYLLDNSFYICADCKHGFLENQIDPNELYNGEYLTESKAISSKLMITKFISFLSKSNYLSCASAIVDIGANDGTLLSLLKDENLNIELFGIDPVWKENELVKGKQGFYEDLNINEYLKARENRLFLATHFLEHVPDPVKSLRKFWIDMAKNDKLILLFPALETLLVDCRFESIHHQHLHYFSYESFNSIAKDVGFEIIESWIDSDLYGAACVVLTKSSNSNNPLIKQKKDTWFEFSEKLDLNGISFIEYAQNRLAIFKHHIQSINQQLNQNFYVGIGGGALMTPIIFYYLSKWDAITEIYDDDLNRIGKKWANTPLVIQKTPETLIGKNVLVVGSVSKLVGRSLFIKATDLNANTILFPTLGS